jgi:hypothetical protein
MTSRLDLYLTLERVMLDLDEADDPLADRVRDLMDPVWYSLSPSERAILDARHPEHLRLLNPIRLAPSGILVAPVTLAENTSDVDPCAGLRVVTGWEQAA